jgi:hypothetical protein
MYTERQLVEALNELQEATCEALKVPSAIRTVAHTAVGLFCHADALLDPPRKVPAHIKAWAEAARKFAVPAKNRLSSVSTRTANAKTVNEAIDHIAAGRLLFPPGSKAYNHLHNADGLIPVKMPVVKLADQ